MPDYGVRLVINVNADDPQEAVQEFIDELLIQGLNNLTYNVHDRETGVDYIATVEEFAEASVLLAEGEDTTPLLGDPGTDAGPFQSKADLAWNGPIVGSEEDVEEETTTNDLKLPVKGVCKRCGDLAEVDPDTGLCPQCAEDVQGVPA